MALALMHCGQDRLGLNDTLPTGKYQGQEVHWIVQTNPGYIIWLQNTRLLEFTKDVIELATEVNFRASIRKEIRDLDKDIPM